MISIRRHERNDKRCARRDLLSRLYEPLFIVLLMKHDWQHVLVVPIIIRRMLVLICNYRYNCAQDPRGPNKQSLPPHVVPPVCASTHDGETSPGCLSLLSQSLTRFGLTFFPSAREEHHSYLYHPFFLPINYPSCSLASPPSANS